MASNTTTRDFSWRDLVIRANPDHVRDSRYMTEYEFTAWPGGDPRYHEGNKRVFKANYDERGAYAAETASSTGITWGTIPIEWDGEELVWGDA
jgi:hypothetical protein